MRKNKDYAYGLLLLSAYAYRALYHFIIRIHIFLEVVFTQSLAVFKETTLLQVSCVLGKVHMLGWFGFWVVFGFFLRYSSLHPLHFNALCSYYSLQAFSRVGELVFAAGTLGSEGWQRRGYTVSSNTQPGDV